MPNVVQFMHSGDEVDVRALTRYNGWNATGEHSRRLMRHYGEYVDLQNRIMSADLAFWTEYEAPTNAMPITVGARGWKYAENYHTIVLPVPHPPITRGGCCVNTDPCVFGDTFKYSNCRQVPGGSLRGLPVGSLILFGARHMSRKGVFLFALDTVFVIGMEGVQYSVPVGKSLPFAASNEYREVTLGNLQPRRRPNGAVISDFEFYRGRIPQRVGGDKVDTGAIFSYTPVRLFGTQNCNERCMLDLNQLNTFMQNNNIVSRRFFSPEMTQGHSGVLLHGTTLDIQLIWNEVRRIVQAVNRFDLGVHFPWHIN